MLSGAHRRTLSPKPHSVAEVDANGSLWRGQLETFVYVSSVSFPFTAGGPMAAASGSAASWKEEFDRREESEDSLESAGHLCISHSI